MSDVANTQSPGVALPQLRRWMRANTRRRRTIFQNVQVLAVVCVMSGFLAGLTTYWVGVNVEHERADMSLQFDSIKAALLTHAELTARQTGRSPVLPCPDLTGDGVAAESCGVGELEGMVPWRTLGIPPSITINGWDNPVVYKVDRPNAHVCAGRQPRKGGLLLSRQYGGIKPDRTIVSATFVLQSFKPVASVRDDLAYIDAGVGSMFLNLCQATTGQQVATL